MTSWTRRGVRRWITAGWIVWVVSYTLWYQPLDSWNNLSIAEKQTDPQCLSTTQQYAEIHSLTREAIWIGNCGDETKYHRPTPNRTSLKETVAHFHPSVVEIHEESSSTYFDRITVQLHAYNYNQQARHQGGDEFVGTLTGWSPDGVLFQTARVWTDLGDGTYRVTFRIPRIELAAYRMTLMHYYTCYDGFLQYSATAGASTYRLQRGPMMLLNSSSYPFRLPHPKDAQSLLHHLWEERNVCESSQESIEQLTEGIWMERMSARTSYPELTLNAQWTPFCCRVPTFTTNSSVLRIGSSTMPHPTLQVGDVYDLKRNFHNKWIQFLWQRAPTEENTIILSSGLHFLFNGYHPADCVQLILRMICQLAYRFSGRILVVGPVPIQQHLYDRVDMTDLNVMWINALLYQVIQVEAAGQLERICVDRTDLAEFQTVPRMGHILKGAEAEKALKRLRAKLSFQMTTEEIELTKFFNETTSKEERVRVYSNRSIWFANIEQFLRPRPETYVLGDKIHDKRDIKGTSLFQTAHSELIKQLGMLRAGAGP
ncbi:hypothetical protein FisN_13Lh316 [Fistulifera solaris]|uniref:Uncharacterized protein n=1 Tax=Fistulifera solaris TaxID=1519565 RepID=A0A1Z5KLE1_FISSO|nr:hypothetical protein FisN_13Lh316 [Fistulifera solaris]|eukprot:GAX27134.1 hypothetical protein FisN_13Lh316 [Fistulifera solaris]